MLRYNIVMIILGITGAIGHGKSTIAEILSKLEPNSRTFETSEVISDVATQLCKHFDHKIIKLHDLTSINNWLSYLPANLSKTLNRPIDAKLFLLTPSMIGSTTAEYAKLWEFIDWAKSNPELVHTVITQENKANFRPLLQWIGGFCVENISPIIWNTELLERARIAGAEGCALAILGGIRFNEEALHVQNNGGLIVEIIRPSIQVQDSSDPTERQRTRIKPEHIIMNDGSLQELTAKVEKLYAEIKSTRPKA